MAGLGSPGKTGGSAAPGSAAPASAATFVGLPDTPAAIAPLRSLHGNAAGDALEFIRQITQPGGIQIVPAIPADDQGAVLYLQHPAHTAAGARLDRQLTPGYAAPDLYGYSDGTAAPAAGRLTGNWQARHLAWIGSDRGTRTGAGAVTSWEVDYIASQSEAWLAGVARVWLGGTGYDLSGLSYQGGVWLAGVVRTNTGPTFANGAAVAFNLEDGEGNLLFTDKITPVSAAGLLWWDRTRYVLLGSDAVRSRGAHDPSLAYLPGDLVFTEGAYLCIAAAAANTAIGDTTRWAALWRPSIVDVTGQGLPRITAGNRDQLHADFTIPRLYITRSVPVAGVAARGAGLGAFVAAGKFKGTLDAGPAVAETGDIYFNRQRLYWGARTLTTQGEVWAATSFDWAWQDFAGDHYWLGERSGVTDAAAHVVTPIDATGIYLYWNTQLRRLERLNAADFTPATKPYTDYQPVPVMTWNDRRPEVLADTLAGDGSRAELGGNRWKRNTTGRTVDANTGVVTPAGTPLNQILFRRQLTPHDDGKLLCVELEWEEHPFGAAADSVAVIHRRFMAAIPAHGFRRMVERRYTGPQSNRTSGTGSADWYIRRPYATAGGLNNWAEMRISYGRFRGAYLANGLTDNTDAARAAAPDGMAFQFGVPDATLTSLAIWRKFKGRFELHG